MFDVMNKNYETSKISINVFLFLITAAFIYPVMCHDRPIIGVLTEESSYKFSKYGSSSMIASYVKFLESSGARVVPIMIFKPYEYYEDLLGKINGVLFPGGATYLLQSSGYGKASRIIYDLARKINQEGDYFPLWGTCLGFELLNYLAVDDLWMKACSAMDLPADIKLVNGSEDSRLFKDIDDSLLKIIQNENITINYHQWCLTLKNYTLSGLDKHFKVLAVNQDFKNLTFISIIEAHDYPFYGVAFHPEKTIFEWMITQHHQHIPHTANAIKISRYFGDFFVNEARKNHHRFPNETLENDVLIYNYNTTFTGKSNSDTVEYYFFP